MLAERRGVGEGVYVEPVVFASKAVEEEVSVDLASQLPCITSSAVAETYLRLDQDQVNEQHHEVMLDILVGELLAARTLCESHAFSQRAVVRLRVLSIESLDGVAALYADGHSCAAAIGEALRVWR